MHLAIRMLQRIPKGKVVTYKEMARICNTSPRAIGRIMAGNQNPVDFPCYKVVSSQGALCGYSASGGLKKKRELLEREGIMFTPSDSVDKRYFYTFKKSDILYD